MTTGHLLFARAFLLHCARIGRIAWREYNYLMKDVNEAEHRALGCETKDALSFQQARQVQRRHGRNDKKIYRCRVCGWWHMANVDSQQEDDREAACRRQRIEEMRAEELSRA